MKICFIVYHDCNKEARTYELLQCCQLLADDVLFVSYAAPNNLEGIHSYIINKQSEFALINLLVKAKQVIKKEEPDVILLHDNDTAALIPFIKKHFPNTRIIYDSSELYIPMPGKRRSYDWGNGLHVVVKQFFTGFRNRYEKKYLNQCDIVIAANKERAEIMVKYFGLKTNPIVFDNIHMIRDEYDVESCSARFDKYFKDGSFNILFAGGISEGRDTLNYVSSFMQMGEGYNLIILGNASDIAKTKYKRIVEESHSKASTSYLGFVSRAELKYCFSKSQASVVIFTKDTYNNLYCASGKCYEGLFEGVPILTSENPPLKSMCTEFGIGISNDNYAMGIKQLKDNYSLIKESVNTFVKSLNYDARINSLKEELICELNSKAGDQ